MGLKLKNVKDIKVMYANHIPVLWNLIAYKEKITDNVVQYTFEAEFDYYFYDTKNSTFSACASYLMLFESYMGSDEFNKILPKSIVVSKDLSKLVGIFVDMSEGVNERLNDFYSTKMYNGYDSLIQFCRLLDKLPQDTYFNVESSNLQVNFSIYGVFTLLENISKLFIQHEGNLSEKEIKVINRKALDFFAYNLNEINITIQSLSDEAREFFQNYPNCDWDRNKSFFEYVADMLQHERDNIQYCSKCNSYYTKINQRLCPNCHNLENYTSFNYDEYTNIHKSDVSKFYISKLPSPFIYEIFNPQDDIENLMIGNKNTIIMENYNIIGRKIVLDRPIGGVRSIKEILDTTTSGLNIFLDIARNMVTCTGRISKNFYVKTLVDELEDIYVDIDDEKNYIFLSDYTLDLHDEDEDEKKRNIYILFIKIFSYYLQNKYSGKSKLSVRLKSFEYPEEFYVFPTNFINHICNFINSGKIDEMNYDFWFESLLDKIYSIGEYDNNDFKLKTYIERIYKISPFDDVKYVLEEDGLDLKRLGYKEIEVDQIYLEKYLNKLKGMYGNLKSSEKFNKYFLEFNLKFSVEKNYIIDKMYVSTGGKLLTLDKFFKNANNKETLEVIYNIFSAWPYVEFDERIIRNDKQIMVDYITKKIVCIPAYDSGWLGFKEFADKYLTKYTYIVNLIKGNWTLDEIKNEYLSYGAVCPICGIYYNNNNKIRLEKYTCTRLPDCEELEITSNFITKEVCPECYSDVAIMDMEDITKIVQAREPVYSDKIASHYSFTEEYNLKIYTEYIKSKIDDNTLMNNIKKQDKKVIEQELFIPKKLVLDENENLIGYLYDKVDFSKIKQIDKAHNKLQLKCLEKLAKYCETLKENGYTIYSFCKNGLFVDPRYKGKLQFVNIDMVKKKEWPKDENVKAYLINTIKSVFKNNIYLKTLNLKNYIRTSSISSIISSLDILINELKYFCPKHEIFHNGEHTLCPLCYPNIDKMPILKNKVFRYEINEGSEELFSGGESNIYRYPYRKLAKIFKANEINIDFKKEILIRLAGKYKALKNANIKNVFFGIPEAVVIDGDNIIVGYILNEFQDTYNIVSLRDVKFLENNNITRQFIIEIMVTVGRGIEFLHQIGIYFGDLNGCNILFDLNKNVYFIDFDGMGVDDLAPVFFNYDFCDPIIDETGAISPESDWYSYAVQAFYYMTHTHPFNGLYYENGINLEQGVRMKKRISVLGNHGVEIPAIAEPWDWLGEKLISKFLAIFETDLRVSLVQDIKELLTNDESYEETYLDEVKTEVSEIQDIEDEVNDEYTEESKTPEVEKEIIIHENGKEIRITPIFKDEKSNLSKVISEKVYVTCDNRIVAYGNAGGVLDFDISNEWDLPDKLVDNVGHIEDVYVFSLFAVAVFIKNEQDLTDAFLIYDNGEYVIFENILAYCIDGENMCYTQDGYKVYEVKVNNSIPPKQHDIKKIYTDDLEILSFLVRNGKRIVTLNKEADGSWQRIKGNKELLYSYNTVLSDTHNTKVKNDILYDEISGSWLVLNFVEGISTIIQPNGVINQICIDFYACYKSYTYFDKILYYSGDGKIHGINLFTQTRKSFRCDVAKPTSRIKRIIDKKVNGFVITNSDESYIYSLVK